MILGPLLLFVFVVAFAIPFAITRDALKSLTIAGAVAAAPVGAYFGGFWGFVGGAALGALLAASIPAFTIAGTIGIVGCSVMAVLVFSLDGIAKALGVSFETVFYAVWTIWFVGGYAWMMLTAPVSRFDRESILDKIEKRTRPAVTPNVQQMHELRSEPPGSDDHQVVSNFDDGDDEGQPEA